MNLTKPKLKTIEIGDIKLNGFVYIPPMAGYTDYAYRKLCQGFDPDVLMSTEMLSSKAMMYQEHIERMDLGPDEHLTGIQLFGHEPEVMAQAAIKATKAGAKFIDINFGCPVPKITKGMDGAAMMQHPELATEVVKAVIKVTHLPVTVKTRLGWCYSSLNGADLAKRFEDCGIKALTIHGRTRSQKYEGTARWDLIAEVVKAVSIPVFANGDVKTLEDVERILETSGARGVAIARGTMGRPWFSKQVNHYLRTGEKLPDPIARDKCTLALKHCKMLTQVKGEESGARESRKHLVNYSSGLPGASKLRGKLIQVNSYQEADDLVNELLINNGFEKTSYQESVSGFANEI